MKNIIKSIIIAIMIAMSLSSCKKEPLEFPQNNLVVEDTIIGVDHNVSYSIIGFTHNTDTIFDKFYPNYWNVPNYNGARLTIIKCIETYIYIDEFGDTFCESFDCFQLYYNFGYSYITFLLFPEDANPYDEDFYKDNPKYWMSARFIIFNNYVIITNTVHNKKQIVVMSYEDLEKIQEFLRSIDLSKFIL